MKNYDESLTRYWDSTGDWRLNYYNDLHLRENESLTKIEKLELDLDRKEFEILEKLINRKSINRIIDIGCGVGRTLKNFILKYPDKNFVGVDISEYQIKLFNDQIREMNVNNIKAFVMDASNINELKEPFDLIMFCNNSLGCISENGRKTCISQIASLLNTNGIVFVSSFDKIDIAESCYKEWGNRIIQLNRQEEFVELDYYRSYWKSKQSLIDEFVRVGLYNTYYCSAGLGGIYLFSKSEESVIL